MKKHTVEEIGAKMDALGVWDTIASYNWAIKPKGSVFPYFCQLLKTGDDTPIKNRFLMLEGWQTLHDYVCMRVDESYGFYTSPMEMPHYELVTLKTGECKVFRHDAGYMPHEATETQKEFVARILWEAYGVMMRIESDRNLPLKFTGEQAIFARVEGSDGMWCDEPLVIPPPRPYVEKVAFAKDDITKAKDLPIMTGERMELDFRICMGIMTKEPRPRTIYELLAVNSATGEKIIDSRTSMHPELGLKGMWESVAPQILKALIGYGRIPGEIAVKSQRLFRMLRPLCIELPFKLSIHDSLPALAAK